WEAPGAWPSKTDGSESAAEEHARNRIVEEVEDTGAAKHKGREENDEHDDDQDGLPVRIDPKEKLRVPPTKARAEDVVAVEAGERNDVDDCQHHVEIEGDQDQLEQGDRKSTRLNSSHQII